MTLGTDTAPSDPLHRPRIHLRPISPASAGAILAGRAPADVEVAKDHPTEFSAGVARAVGEDSAALGGPYFVHRTDDGVVVGEIGAAFTGPGTVEIGYAIVGSSRGRSYATEAVRAVVAIARDVAGVGTIVGHTPLDRPESARVLEKAGFALVGEEDDEHEGESLRVECWQLRLVRAGG